MKPATVRSIPTSPDRTHRLSISNVCFAILFVFLFISTTGRLSFQIVNGSNGTGRDRILASICQELSKKKKKKQLTVSREMRLSPFPLTAQRAAVVRGARNEFGPLLTLVPLDALKSFPWQSNQTAPKKRCASFLRLSVRKVIYIYLPSKLGSKLLPRKG